MIVLALALSLLIGVSLGLLGGGGSILTLPILVYVLGVDPKAAIAMSLFVVGVTSAVGSVAHARAGRVELRTGLVFAATAMAGAYAGGRVAHHLPSTLLLAAFGVIMLVTSAAMMRGRRADGGAAKPPQALKVLAIGAAVGVVSGLVGAGGGFLIVPALALFGGMTMPRAVGTSLVVIALQSFAGLAGHLGHTELDWTLTGLITAAAIAGSFAGARASRRISPDALRRGFAWFVLAMALFLLGKQIPRGALAALRDHAWLVVVVAGFGGALAAIAAAVRARHGAGVRDRA